jgi:hypothetical protein
MKLPPKKKTGYTNLRDIRIQWNTTVLSRLVKIKLFQCSCGLPSSFRLTTKNQLHNIAYTVRRHLKSIQHISIKEELSNHR